MILPLIQYDKLTQYDYYAYTIINYKNIHNILLRRLWISILSINAPAAQRSTPLTSLLDQIIIPLSIISQVNLCQILIYPGKVSAIRWTFASKE